MSLGKLSLHAPFNQLIPAQLRANRIELLPISPDHLTRLLTLPYHHRDPFDRILIAQAEAEGAILVSADATLDQYAVRRLW